MQPVELRAFRADDLNWIVQAHARAYAKEAGFDSSFADVVREVAQGFIDRADSRERGFVAMSGDRRVGSILSCRAGDETGQVRLFLVHPDWRGTGLATRMLRAAEDFARDAGCRDMILWTHESHRAACALYARCGWTEEISRPVRNYGQHLIEMKWSRPL